WPTSRSLPPPALGEAEIFERVDLHVAAGRVFLVHLYALFQEVLQQIDQVRLLERSALTKLAAREPLLRPVESVQQRSRSRGVDLHDADELSRSPVAVDPAAELQHALPVRPQLLGVRLRVLRAVDVAPAPGGVAPERDRAGAGHELLHDGALVDDVG